MLLSLPGVGCRAEMLQCCEYSCHGRWQYSGSCWNSLTWLTIHNFCSEYPVPLYFSLLPSVVYLFITLQCHLHKLSISAFYSLEMQMICSETSLYSTHHPSFIHPSPINQLSIIIIVVVVDFVQFSNAHASSILCTRKTTKEPTINSINKQSPAIR